MTGSNYNHIRGLKFNIKADLRDVFTWNVKQIFVYVTFVPTNQEKPEIIIWDRIISSKKDAKLALYKIPSKYRIEDYDDVLSETPFKLVLKWNVMPWIGFLSYENRNGLISKALSVASD